MTDIELDVRAFQPTQLRPRDFGRGLTACLCLLALVPACTESNPHANASEASSESVEASTGDESEGATSEESEGACTPGSLDCECGAGATCDAGLSCIDGFCLEFACGNGVVEGDEACDDGEANAFEAACLPDCTLNVCGDGYLGPDEQCDDQNDDEQDGCRSNCLLTDSPTCGNGEIDPGEFCYGEFFVPSTPAPIEAMDVADVDGDGVADIAIAMGTGAGLSVALMPGPIDPESSFEDPLLASQEPSLTGVAPSELVLGRFGNDASTHLLAIYPEPLNSQVHEFRFEQAGLVEQSALVSSILLQRFEGLADFGPNEPHLALFTNEHNLNVAFAQGAGLSYEYPAFAQTAAPANRDRGGDQSIYALTFDGELLTLERQGLEIVLLGQTRTLEGSFLVAADLNGDAIDEAIVINTPACPPGVPDLCDQSIIAVALGSDDNSAPLQPSAESGFFGLAGASAAAAAEVNGDALEDLVLVSDTFSELEFIESDAELSAKWKRVIPLEAFGAIRRIVVEDLNDDSVDDVLLFDGEGQQLRMLLSNP